VYNSAMSKSLGIFLIASEAFPLAKVDGLADVIGALPKALAKLGHQVSIAIPFYTCIRCEEFLLTPLGEPFNVEVADEGF